MNMDTKGKWPKFIQILYYESSSGGVVGYSAFVNNQRMLCDAIYRRKMNYQDVSFFYVGTTDIKEELVLLSKEQVKKTFEKVEEYRKELEVIEARKKIEQEAEDAAKKSRPKSR